MAKNITTSEFEKSLSEMESFLQEIGIEITDVSTMSLSAEIFFDGDKRLTLSAPFYYFERFNKDTNVYTFIKETTSKNMLFSTIKRHCKNHVRK